MFLDYIADAPPVRTSHPASSPSPSLFCTAITNASTIRHQAEGQCRGHGHHRQPAGLFAMQPRAASLAASRIAVRRIAARGARVQLRPLADHNAAGLAVGGAAPLQRPHARPGRGVLRARRVREPLHHAREFRLVALAGESGVVGGDVVHALDAVVHRVTGVAPQVVWPLGGGGRLVNRIGQGQVMRLASAGVGCGRKINAGVHRVSLTRMLESF